MCQINLLKLSIISLSTIHASTNSSPRGGSSSITFISFTLIFIRKLVEIDITFSINGLGSRIIHTTINNHLIHTTKLIILLVQNGSGTKSAITNNSSRTTIGNICLCNILQTSNLKRKLSLLRIRSIGTRIIIPNKGTIAIQTLNLISTSLIIKRQKTGLANRSRTSTLQINKHTMSGNNLNTTRSITTFVHKHTIRRNSAVISNTNNLISITLETNTSKAK